MPVTSKLKDFLSHEVHKFFLCFSPKGRALLKQNKRIADRNSSKQVMVE